MSYDLKTCFGEKNFGVFDILKQNIVNTGEMEGVKNLRYCASYKIVHNVSRIVASSLYGERARNFSISLSLHGRGAELRIILSPRVYMGEELRIFPCLKTYMGGRSSEFFRVAKPIWGNKIRIFPAKPIWEKSLEFLQVDAIYRYIFLHNYSSIFSTYLLIFFT